MATQVTCLMCGDVLVSRHRHDFNTCRCEAVSVDGGPDRTRILGDPENYVLREDVLEVKPQTKEVMVPSLHSEFFVGERVDFSALGLPVSTGTILGIATCHVVFTYIVGIDPPIPIGDPHRPVPWQAIVLVGGYLRRLSDTLQVARDLALSEGQDTPEGLRNAYLKVSGINLELSGFAGGRDEEYWQQVWCTPS